MVDKDKNQVVRQFITTYDPKYLSDDVVLVDHTLPEPLRGKAAVTRMLDMFYQTAFPGSKVDIQEMIQDANLVVVEYLFKGENAGNLMGNPATHRMVELPMCAIYEVEGGLIRQIRVYYDSALLTKQLGLGPAIASK
jgi:steroid delta-isomerase-like uncharacterized protein